MEDEGSGAGAGMENERMGGEAKGGDVGGAMKGEGAMRHEGQGGAMPSEGMDHP
jgi:hypothetical protein